MEVLADNFLAYKDGFMEAKERIIMNYKFGKAIDLDNMSNGLNSNEWHDYGYKDGIAYFLPLIESRRLDLTGRHELEYMQDNFSQRVIAVNEEVEQNTIKVSK